MFTSAFMCVFACGGRGARHQTNREMERACRFGGKDEMCFFTSVIRVRPHIGMKRSLIKSESGRGAVGWRSIARGKNPNGAMFLNEVIGVLLD